MTHAFHKDQEFHHHHHHSSGSHHECGAHVFQLEEVSVTIQNTYFKKSRLFAKSMSDTVVDNCNLSLHEGETLFLIGESGSGKSMMLDIFCGSLPKNARLDGNVWFRGKKIEFKNLRKNAQENINFIPQSIKSLDPLAKYECKGKKRYPHELSGGLCRQALISDSIKKGASITVADEPTEGLDEKSALEIMRKLISCKGEKGCLLVITHDVDLAIKHADRIAILKKGRIVEETSTKAFCDGKMNNEYALKISKCLPSRITFKKEEIETGKQIIIDNLSIKFDDKDVIEKMSDVISSDEITCFFGETGSGKSTLCKAIARWLKPTPGKIKIDGSVQYVCQNPFDAFNPKLTIRKSMATIGKKPCSACDDLLNDAMAVMSVDDRLLDRLPSELSGGELQKFAILRSLVALPDFLILDEATSMLDVVSQKEIFDFVLKIQPSLKFGLIFVTHDRDLCEKISDRVIRF